MYKIFLLNNCMQNPKIGFKIQNNSKNNKNYHNSKRMKNYLQEGVLYLIGDYLQIKNPHKYHF